MRDCACAIFVRDGRVLLARRSPAKPSFPDCWDVVGGHVEPGETVEDALVRESEEETGLTPTRYARVESLHLGGKAYHFYLVVEWRGGEPALLGDEHTELRWFTVEEACLLGPLALPEYRTLLGNLLPHLDDAGSLTGVPSHSS